MNVGLTLTTTMKDFYLNYENFLIALAKYLGTEDINAITVVDVREGSIITDLQVAPTSDPGSTEAKNQLTALLSLVK